MDFSRVEFLLSVHRLKQLPPETLPEVAFAGRSNVGKSSLINSLLRRKGMVKTSSRPGKTQGLNYFRIGDDCYFVDLPGYGFARVPRGMQNAWQTLISSYLEKRATLSCVVVIIDSRHEAKAQDRQLLDWLRFQHIPMLPVYTKTDKLSGSQLGKNAALLDKGHGLEPDQRVLFSAKSGKGRNELLERLAIFLNCPKGVYPKGV
jgi:GTP-binding protein